MSEERTNMPTPTIFNEYKLKLIGPKQEGASKPPTLSVNVWRNNPRIEVKTNVPNDRDYGRINAPMDILSFNDLIEYIDIIANGPNGEMLPVKNNVGAPGFEKQVSTTIVGKDAEGRMYISVTAKDRPKIKFVFKPSNWHVFCKKDFVTPLSEAEVSVPSAKAWAKTFQTLVNTYIANNYVHVDFSKDKADNKKNYGKPNYQPAQNRSNVDADSFFEEDDLPM